MPKIKTRRSAAKRFQVTGSGKFKRRRQNLRRNRHPHAHGASTIRIVRRPSMSSTVACAGNTSFRVSSSISACP